MKTIRGGIRRTKISTPLMTHYYSHAPRGFGADPSDCVVCKHTHPELETKIDQKFAQYTFYSLAFLVGANILTEWTKRKLFK